MTGPNTDTYYSSVVSLRATRTMIFLAELDGKEFQDYGYEGHLMLIVKALYGLKTSTTRFHEKFAEAMYQLGFMLSKADSDVLMKGCKDHWEYVCTWVEDLLYSG
eukprot:11722863-Ditylum_brightwellii.AAC.1